MAFGRNIAITGAIGAGGSSNTNVNSQNFIATSSSVGNSGSTISSNVNMDIKLDKDQFDKLESTLINSTTRLSGIEGQLLENKERLHINLTSLTQTIADAYTQESKIQKQLANKRSHQINRAVDLIEMFVISSLLLGFITLIHFW